MNVYFLFKLDSKIVYMMAQKKKVQVIYGKRLKFLK